jgi:hypothetical protein
MFVARDSVTGDMALQYGREWLLRGDATDSGIVLTAWAAIEMALVHEAREDFYYKGRRVLGPHIDIEGLWRNARKVDL